MRPDTSPTGRKLRTTCSTAVSTCRHADLLIRVNPFSTGTSDDSADYSWLVPRGERSRLRVVRLSSILGRCVLAARMKCELQAFTFPATPDREAVECEVRAEPPLPPSRGARRPLHRTSLTMNVASAPRLRALNPKKPAANFKVVASLFGDGLFCCATKVKKSEYFPPQIALPGTSAIRFSQQC